MSNNQIKSVVNLFGNALKAGEKATTAFKNFVGFKSEGAGIGDAPLLEANYKLILADDSYKSAPASAQVAMRNLMTWIRGQVGYTVKGGKVSPKAPSTTKGAKTDKGEAKDKPQGDAAVLKRFSQLATQFLTAEDKLIAARLVAAIANGIKLATASKK
jgi:hypothetical protein